MSTSSIISWEDRLTHISFSSLFLAIVYGIGAGTVVAMYYDVTPDMGLIEDRLISIQPVLFLLAVVIGFFHLPMLMLDFKGKLWGQAVVRTIAFVSPLIIYLGTDGILSHSLWWAPISDTDRFHMLHHTVVVGAPLTFGYWLALRRWWHPETFDEKSLPPRRSWLVTGLVLVIVVMAVGTLVGLITPFVFGLTAAIGLVALLLMWRVAG